MNYKEFPPYMYTVLIIAIIILIFHYGGGFELFSNYIDNSLNNI